MTIIPERRGLSELCRLGFLELLEPLPGKAHNDGTGDGGEDAEEQNFRKILLNEGNVAEEVACADNGNGPEDRARAAEEFKAQSVHSRRTGNQRRKGADDGHETGEENGFAAVRDVELVRMLKLFRIQPTDVAVVNFVSQPFPGRIAYGIAEDCTENDGKHDHPGTRRTRGSNGAGDEKKRIARQKRHDDASRFQKEDDEHRDIDERAVVCRKRHEKMSALVKSSTISPKMSMVGNVKISVKEKARIPKDSLSGPLS